VISAPKGKASLQIPSRFSVFFFGASWIPWGVSNKKKQSPFLWPLETSGLCSTELKLGICYENAWKKLQNIIPNGALMIIYIVNSEKSPKKNKSMKKTTLNEGEWVFQKAFLGFTSVKKKTSFWSTSLGVQNF